MNRRSRDEWAALRSDLGSRFGDRDAQVEAARLQTVSAEKLGRRLLWYTIAIAFLTLVLCVLTAFLAWPEVLKWRRGHQDDWVLYKYGGGAVGTFKALEDCQGASKRQPTSSECYPSGVNPR